MIPILESCNCYEHGTAKKCVPIVKEATSMHAINIKYSCLELRVFFLRYDPPQDTVVLLLETQPGLDTKISSGCDCCAAAF